MSADHKKYLNENLNLQLKKVKSQQTPRKLKGSIKDHKAIKGKVSRKRVEHIYSKIIFHIFYRTFT